MATKVGTLSIGRRAAENLLHGVRFAKSIGQPLNTHVTVSFTVLGIDDDQAGALFQDLQSRVVRWWAYQRSKGRVTGQLLGVHSHANPAGSRHVHWLTAVPSEIAAEFEAVVADRLRKVTGRIDLRDALDVGPVSGPGGLAKYILRGIDPDYAAYLSIEPANEGRVTGRRTGTSRGLGKATRKRAGWVRKRRPR